MKSEKQQYDNQPEDKKQTTRTNPDTPRTMITPRDRRKSKRQLHRVDRGELGARCEKDVDKKKGPRHSTHLSPTQNTTRRHQPIRSKQEHASPSRETKQINKPTHSLGAEVEERRDLRSQLPTPNSPTAANSAIKFKRIGRGGTRNPNPSTALS